MVKETISELPPSVQLLTLINVANSKPPSTSSSSSTKRPSSAKRDWYSIAKKAKLSSSTSATPSITPKPSTSTSAASTSTSKDSDSEDETEGKPSSDHFTHNWGPTTPLLVPSPPKLVLQPTRLSLPPWGEFSQYLPAPSTSTSATPIDLAKIYSTKLLNENTDGVERGLLKQLTTFADFYKSNVVLGEEHEVMRKSICLHVLNHVMKTRSLILKNNSRLSTNTKALPQDQSFTRPKVLLLTPFRNSAYSWVTQLLSLIPDYEIENLDRFIKEYTLPEGVDKLADPTHGSYTTDHRLTFSGNIDDEARLGIKVLRKGVRLFAEFFGADIVVGTPLGLRKAIEKDGEGGGDWLSGIEMVVLDQGEVMGGMQSWDHVKFLLDRLNKLPIDTHGVDMFRVKPWYLDEKASSLRQTILLSSYPTPELNHLSSITLNVRGRIKSFTNYKGVLSEVKEGVRQVWIKVDTSAGGIEDETEKRWECFTTKTLPGLLKSAVSSTQTIIFVPSYFDFVRVKKHFKIDLKSEGISWTSISEYSSIPDVSRARGAFFSGKVNFLIVTERFHFFHRYKLRGSLTTFFYAPPEHAEYYSEFLSFPFLVNDTVEPSDTQSLVMFSRFDRERVERICGRVEARKMCEGEGARFEFV